MSATTVELDSDQPGACAVCDRRIGPGLLMCRFHWGLLPAGLRTRVNHAWARYRFATAPSVRLNHLRFYREAREAAIASVHRHLDDLNRAIDDHLKENQTP